MATEAKRGCGYRKVGGIYLMADAPAIACDRLPFELTVCPTCSGGIKQSRGWTWVDAQALTDGPHGAGNDGDCFEQTPCVFCDASLTRAGLLWIGGRFYKNPGIFMDEARLLGVSRRISTVPKGLKLGEAWVLLAHPEAVPAECKYEPTQALDGPCQKCAALPEHDNHKAKPGIFALVRPTRLEVIVTKTQSKDADYMAKLAKRGLTPVVVPDNDKDHQGSVFDAEEEEQPEEIPA